MSPTTAELCYFESVHCPRSCMSAIGLEPIASINPIGNFSWENGLSRTICYVSRSLFPRTFSSTNA
jgi:hypothetical protein